VQGAAVEILGAVVAGALFWLPRIAVISLALTAVIWVTTKSASWFVPQRGDQAPEFEVVGGNAEQNVLLARLLQAEFMSIKGDLSNGAETVDRLLQAWTTEFEATNRRRQLGFVSSPVQSGAPVPTQSEATIPSLGISAAGVDLTRVKAVTEKLKILSNDINAANVPDIKIASVELGPILRWLIDMLRPPSDNKILIFDESSAALIKGPIVPDGAIVLELDPLTDPKKRTARQIVEPVAYQIIASKLASAEPKIEFGNWAALRDFVVGTKNLANLISQPQPGQDDRAEWDKQVAGAAHLIAHAGVAARDWRFMALASFLFERSKDFDNAIRLLDQYAEFTYGNKEAEDDREARLAYLRDRRVEFAVTSALEGRKGDGAVFAATTTALAGLPSVVAARKLHWLDGATDRPMVKIAILSGAKPPWFGLDRPPDRHPLEDALDAIGANLAQMVRALTPSADVVFVPVGHRPPVVEESDYIPALDAVASTDVPVILLPITPQRAPTIQAVERLVKMGHLVIVPAGNAGGPVDYPLAEKILVAESIDLNGKRRAYSSHVKEALGAVDQLPTVFLTGDGPVVIEVPYQSSNAAASLAAVAVESIARQPELKGTALRDALISAAARPTDPENSPVAKVVIPR
jgi:hypothetical protein